MKIHIEYSGIIKKADLEIFSNEDKIDLLFGLSGIGKSTIVRILQGEKVESWIYDEKPFVLYNNSDLLSGFQNVLVFNEEHSLKIVHNEDMNFYDIISYGKDSIIIDEKINSCIDMAKNLLNDLADIKKEWKYDYVESVLGKVYNAQTNKSKISKLNSEADKIYKASSNKYNKEYILSPVNYVSWRNQGDQLRQLIEGKCPYCLSETDFSKIPKCELKITSSQLSNYNYAKDILHPKYTNDLLLNDALLVPSLFDDYNLKLHIDNIESILKSDIITVALSGEILDLVLSPLNSTKFENRMLTQVNEFNGKIHDFNQVLKDIGDIKAKSGSVLNNIIENKVNIINSLLKDLNIKYEFNFDVDNKTTSAKYYLKPVASTEHRVQNMDELSFGEKNLLSLILTLHTPTTDTLLIFDDPISSFDDLKRNRIIKEITSLYKDVYQKNKNKVLILTHDEYFVRQIIHEDQIASGFNVQAMYRDLYEGEFIFRKIKKKDFITLDDSILVYAANVDLYSKLIILRQYCELKRKNTEDYKYEYDILSNLIKLRDIRAEDNIAIDNRLFSKLLAGKIIITSEEEMPMSEFVKKYQNLDNLKYLDKMPSVDKILALRFLTENYYSYKKPQYHYCLNDLTHLISSPYKTIDYRKHNIYDISINESISDLIEKRK